MSGVARWAAVGFGLYVALGFASLVAVAAFEGAIFGPFGIEVGAGTVGLSLRNGLWHVVWGIAVALVAAPVGRRLVSEARFRLALPMLVLASGVALAGLTELLLNEWARERFGYFDPEYVGFSGFAPPATVAVALAAWAALSVPRESGTILRRLLLLAVAGLVLAVLPSVPGAADGIDPGNLPLAATLVVDGAFAGLAVLISRR